MTITDCIRQQGNCFRWTRALYVKGGYLTSMGWYTVLVATVGNLSSVLLYAGHRASEIKYQPTNEK